MTATDGITRITLPDGDTVEIPDTILLTRSVQGDDYPRVYRLTGKPFAEMLAAVKALPDRWYTSATKSWKVREAGIVALRAAGLTVTVAPPARIERAASRVLGGAVLDGDTWTVRVTLTLLGRASLDEFGGWNEMLRAERVVRLGAAEVSDAHRRDCERLGVAYHGNDHDTAERIACESLKAYGDELIAAFEAARNKQYTKAAYRAGREAVRAKLDADGVTVLA